MKMIVTAFLVAFVMIALVGTVFGPSAYAETDYDTDDDGLIEVANLAKLNAIRWDLNGDGTASSGNEDTYAAAFPGAATGMGCPATGCIGYELTANLDFDTDGDGTANSGDTYWNNGKGWTPIGVFTAEFEGNGNTISNLFVSGPATNAGLFDGIGNEGEVRNLGLTDLTVSVASGKIAGGIAGTLTGDAQIKNSYVSGTVKATGSNSKAGGLVGSMTGSSQIIKSYAAGAVTATGSTTRGGGLTGTLDGTTKILNSYATASVTATGANSSAGGLAAFFTGSAQVQYSYATGAVSASGANKAVGGLLAAKTASATFTDSYWDTTTTGQSDSPGGGSAKNTSQLQSPTSAGIGIYTAWAATNWDFGTADHYPTLKADWDGDGTATAVEFGNQLKDYDDDDDGLIEVSSLAQLNAIRWDLDGNGAAFSGNETAYIAAFPAFRTGMGCPATGCIGYELTADLDFDTDGDGTANSGDTYWNDGAGWTPIGGTFTATFEGNGHVISNIFININSAAARHGLFGILGSGGSIKQVGIDGGSVTSTGSSTHRTGGLAGFNQGTIEFSYSSAAVTTTGDGGGLVGANHGTINSSYATGAVSGNIIGGLVGQISSGGQISDSYATGAIDSNNIANPLIKNDGGLVGFISPGTITNSYSTGGEKLLAFKVAGTVTTSYWDSTLGSSIPGAAGTGTGKTTSELQLPTSNSTGIYATWSADKWDFGTASQYPALKADWDDDGVSTAAEFGNQDLALAFADDASINDIVLTVNTPYTSLDALPAATGGNGTRTYSIADLPNGITLNSERKLTGTATAVLAETTFTYTVTDTDGDTDTLTFKLSVSGSIDYDADNDGLIEVANLAQLNAIRWDLNGDGTSSSGNEADYAVAFPDAAISMGCPATGCIGYELTADLDFDTDGDGRLDVVGDTYWNSGNGWTPIGGSFTAEFEGNGKTITNLFIKYSDAQASDRRNDGLFSVIGTTGEIRNLGLTGASVTSGGNVGVIAGTNKGDITASYADGEVNADGSIKDDIGGGLVGSNTGSITGSYSHAKVSATDIAGGLVGMLAGSITDSYAALDVSTSGGKAGGLVGSILIAGIITNSYSVAPVIGDTGSTVGGLVGAKISSSTITVSYWDTELSGQSASPGGGTGKTTSELQSPTSNIGIYSAWATTHWDFVDANHFPLLKANWDDTSGATWQEFGNQDLAPAFAGDASIADIVLIVNTFYTSPDALPIATGGNGARTYSIADLPDGITLNSERKLTGTATAVLAESTFTYTVEDTDDDTDTLTFKLSVSGSIDTDYDDDNDGLIEVANLKQLNAIRWDLNGDGTSSSGNEANYAGAFPNAASGMGCPATGCIGYELTASLDFDTDGDGTANSGDTYWNNGAGWTPIGGIFNATFEGNGNVISNIFINNNTAANRGLFGVLDSGGSIKQVGINGGSVTSAGSGIQYTGGLVGNNTGTIEFSYSSAAVNATGNVGGLVGILNGGIIKSSYATGAVSGDSVGGLVSVIRNNGQISDSYATGALDSTNTNDGGLVALIQNPSSIITNSYSTGGEKLISVSPGSTVTASYWDSTLGSSIAGVAGSGKTTSELQSPTSSIGIYTAWSADKWDFGTASQYPTLKADWDGDGTATAAEFGDQEFGDQDPAPAFAGFITTWDIASNDKITIVRGDDSIKGNYTINWGDGDTTSTGLGSMAHNYTAAGEYNVTITGNFTHLDLNRSGTDAKKLLAVKQWGNTTWTSMKNAFHGATNLSSIPSDAPDLSKVTSMRGMFNEAISFNQNINNWDVSSVTDTSQMFYEAQSFNEPLNNWDVSSVTDMSHMFYNTTFNQNINNWDVSSVTDMSDMFTLASAFNQPLNNWDVSSVNDMSFMFFYADAFNQPLNNWDVSSVTDMSYMFSAEKFNQNINNWNVYSVNNMLGMFHFALEFNQPLNNWDVSSVTNMTAMFERADSFNQNLGNWYIQLSGTVLFDSGNKIILSAQNLVLSAENLTYELVGGTGSDDNALFEIVTSSGDPVLKLKSGSTPNAENTIRISPAGASIGTNNARIATITSPGTPIVTSPIAGTYNVSSITFSGLAPSSSLVRIYDGDSNLVNATADSAGNWSVEKSSLVDKEYSISATFTVSNTESPKSDVISIIIDTTKPTLTDAVLYEETGILTLTFSETIDITSIDQTKIHIRESGDSSGGVTLSAAKLTSTANNSILSFTLTEADRQAAFELTTPQLDIDPAAVKDVASHTINTTIDQSIRIIETPTPNAPDITSPNDGATLYQSSVTIAGTSSSADGTIITVSYSDNTFIGTATNTDGDWSMKASFSDGDHSIRATVTENGKTSEPSKDVSFTVDTSLPASPVITSPNDGATLRQSSVTIAGTSSSADGTIITVSYSDNTFIGTATNTDGDWSMKASFSDGDHSIRATVTENGKTSEPSKDVSFTVDTSSPPPPPPPPPPASPVITSPNVGATLYQSSVTIAGTSSSASATITVYYSDNTSLGTTTSSADGSWSITVTLDDDDYSITATVTKDGKTSASSSPVSFTVDASLLITPTITSPTTAKTYYNNSITFAGTSSALSLIKIYDGNQSLANTTSDADGVWSVTETLDDGTYSIKVMASKGTKKSLFSNTISFTIITVHNTVFADINNNAKKDTDEPGIANATVIAVNLKDIQTIYKTKTDENGIYKFEDNSVGQFLIQVAPVPKDHKPSGDTVSYTYLFSETELDSDRLPSFSLWPVSPNNATVKGSIFDDSNNNGLPDTGETGFAGVDLFVIDFLTLTVNNATTDADGSYSITGVLPDVVLVQAAPIPAGFLPSDGFTSYSYHTLPNFSVTTVNFPLYGVPAEDKGSVTIDVFHDANENGVKDAGESQVKDAVVFTYELLTAVSDVQVTNASGITTHAGLLPDVVLAQINAEMLPEGFTKITTSNGGFEYITVTKGGMHSVQIGLN